MDKLPIRHLVVVEDAGKFSLEFRRVFLAGVMAGWGVPNHEDFIGRFSPGKEEYTVIWGEDYEHQGVVMFLFGGNHGR